MNTGNVEKIKVRRQKDPNAARSFEQVRDEWESRTGQKLTTMRIIQIHQEAMAKLRQRLCGF